MLALFTKRTESIAAIGPAKPKLSDQFVKSPTVSRAISEWHLGIGPSPEQGVGQSEDMVHISAVVARQRSVEEWQWPASMGTIESVRPCQILVRRFVSFRSNGHLKRVQASNG
jgi:hypothetical protein